ncbi:hypothetical protein N665_0484s0005 [Sinapis alba]|nr:hypothetical protein N665_0484s0005 [Sinapis alba]
MPSPSVGSNCFLQCGGGCGLIPRPPSIFGLHTSTHATFAFVVFMSGPDHRKAEHILSISLMHSLGSLKDESQKFVRLIITELISCNLPAYESALPVHELMHFLIFSTSGK